MKWFRSNIKHGSRIALFALAIQFVLSFGHHHSAAALAAPAVSMQASDTGATQAKTLATKDAAVRASAEAAATSPAAPASSHDQDSDTCAVCAVMALASTVLFTEAPVLLPIISCIWPPKPNSITSNRGASFSSRARLPPPDVD